MASTHITSYDELDHNVHFWKEFKIVKTYLNLEEAVASLSSDNPLVEARPSWVSRWVLCAKNEAVVKEAMFHTAMVWRWNSHTETGNFVPAGAMAESRVAESRVQWEISNLCQFSYGVDTHRDQSLWHAQKAFEAHVQSLEGFNRTGKKRRPWQDGSSISSTYVFSAQIFTRRPGGSARKSATVPYKVHKWIEDAVKKDPNYMPNPARPKMFGIRDGVMQDIKSFDPPYISKGDLVWISFTVEFIIGASSWSTSFTPYEIIRVATVSPELLGGPQNVDGFTDTAPEQGVMEGLVIDTNPDFPMRAIPRPAPVIPPGPPPASTSAAYESTTEASNEVVFGPEHERTYPTWEGTVGDDIESLISWPSTEQDDDVAPLVGGAAEFMDTEAVETASMGDIETRGGAEESTTTVYLADIETSAPTRGSKRKAEEERGSPSASGRGGRRGRRRVRGRS